MTLLSPAERIDALAERGIMLYLCGNGELRARCEPCFAGLLDAARPMLRHHRAALIAQLRFMAARGQQTAARPLTDGRRLCPERPPV